MGSNSYSNFLKLTSHGQTTDWTFNSDDARVDISGPMGDVLDVELEVRCRAKRGVKRQDEAGSGPPSGADSSR